MVLRGHDHVFGLWFRLSRPARVTGRRPRLACGDLHLASSASNLRTTTKLPHRLPHANAFMDVRYCYLTATLRYGIHRTFSWERTRRGAQRCRACIYILTRWFAGPLLPQLMALVQEDVRDEKQPPEKNAFDTLLAEVDGKRLAREWRGNNDRSRYAMPRLHNLFCPWLPLQLAGQFLR